MIKVVVIGSGNVAQHLIKVIKNTADVQLEQAFARNIKALEHLLPQDKITSSYSKLKEADVYIIAVSDDAITNVSSQLPFSGRLVAHTSGSVGMDETDSKNRRGVFYPLQTFSKNKDVDFKLVPLCLETENAEDYILLEKLAKCLSDNVYTINSQQRQALHVAAVFVSNFVNSLYVTGNAICNENNIPFEILKPLIQETAHKVLTIKPQDAQTGPAIRNDKKTIEKHLAFLKDGKQKYIYQLLSESIQENAKKL